MQLTQEADKKMILQSVEVKRLLMYLTSHADADGVVVIWPKRTVSFLHMSMKKFNGFLEAFVDQNYIERGVVLDNGSALGYRVLLPHAGGTAPTAMTTTAPVAVVPSSKAAGITE